MVNLSEINEERDEVGLEVVDLHHLGELPELPACGAAHHRGVVLVNTIIAFYQCRGIDNPKNVDNLPSRGL